MLPGSGSKLLSKELSLRLFQNTENGTNLIPTLYCFKRLFTAVDLLHKPVLKKPTTALLMSGNYKNQTLQLLSNSNFQNYMPILVDFYLRTASRSIVLAPTSLNNNT